MREKIDIYTVDTEYISFLKEDIKLRPFIIDNKAGKDRFPRKYLGVVINENDKNYFIPFSSPKRTDYWINNEGVEKIRKNTLTIFRMVVEKKNGELELKGTLKLNNMIPVPLSALSKYIINDEQDLDYKAIVTKEYTYIKQKYKVILKNAQILYKQKNNETKLDKTKHNYLNSTVPFKYAEEKCVEYLRKLDSKMAEKVGVSHKCSLQEDRKPLEEQMKEAKNQVQQTLTVKSHIIKQKNEIDR